MNTTFGEAFALWFYMSWRSLALYFIVLIFCIIVDMSIGFTTNILTITLIRTLYASAIIILFCSQIYFLRRGIEEYYKDGLE